MAVGNRQLNKQAKIPKFVIRSIDFILFGNIYVAIGAVCLVQSTIIQLGFENHLLSYSLLVFFSTLFIYNLQRIFYKPQLDNSLNSIRRKWILENQLTIKALCFIAFLGTCIVFFYTDFRVVFYLSPLLLLSLAYFIPFIKLRKHAWFKLLTLVIVWTTTTAVVPVLLNNSFCYIPFTECYKEVLHILTRFCFMMAICIPFDIRDLRIDAADTISTLPHKIGEKKTRLLAAFFILIYFLLITLEFKSALFDTKIYIALMLAALINGALVLISTSKRSEYFYVAGIDGTMILQGALLIFISYT